MTEKRLIFEQALQHLVPPKFPFPILRNTGDLEEEEQNQNSKNQQSQVSEN